MLEDILETREETFRGTISEQNGINSYRLEKT
jgi:hypothetical protein